MSKSNNDQRLNASDKKVVKKFLRLNIFSDFTTLSTTLEKFFLNYAIHTEDTPEERAEVASSYKELRTLCQQSRIIAEEQ